MSQTNSILRQIDQVQMLEKNMMAMESVASSFSKIEQYDDSTRDAPGLQSRIYQTKTNSPNKPNVENLNKIIKIVKSPLNDKL